MLITISSRISFVYMFILIQDRKGGILMKTLDYIILILVVIGALNWGLIGFFGIDLIRVLFGNMSFLSRTVYAIVGICGIYAFSYFGRIQNTQ